MCDLSDLFNVSTDYLLTGKEASPPGLKELERLFDKIRSGEVSDAEIAEIVRGMQEAKKEKPHYWEKVKELYNATLAKELDNARAIRAVGRLLGPQGKNEFFMKMVQMAFPDVDVKKEMNSEEGE